MRLSARLLMVFLLCSPALAATDTASDAGRYTFSWPFAEGDALRPRGGTSRGTAVTLDKTESKAFQRLREPGLSTFERDRRAILAMAGPYRVSFDFLEVIGYAPDYQRRRPYQSWGTEYVYPIADEGETIVLQHLMVMEFVGDDGQVHGPMVMKHWRQDWHYQAPAIHVYRGDNTWRQVTADAEARRGQWAQTVWQVSDSPRYAAWGQWRHTDEYSTWVSGRTWRPLPRREFSVRDDYDALVGVNRQTVLPHGWVHEQRNEKVVLAAPGDIEKRLALEYGLARYERIKGFDFSPGDAYLEAAGPFWQLVRQYWDRLLAEHSVVHLRKQVDQTKLFQPLFARARQIADGERDFDAEADRRFVEQTIGRYVAEQSADDTGY